MTLDIENLYQIFAFILTFLFALYLLLTKTKERTANVYIGLFILFMSMDNLDTLLMKTSFYNEHPVFYFWIVSTSFLFAPLMYFYIRAVAYKGIKLKWSDSIHAIPFILFLVVTISQYHLQPKEIQLKILTTTDGFNAWFLPVSKALLHLQALTYMVLSIRVVLRFKKIVKENYSSVNKRNYLWILQLTFVFVYFVVSGLIINIIRFGADRSYEGILFYVLAPINIAFLIWLIYKALSQPYLFNGIDANIKLLEEYLKEKEQLQKETETDTSVNQPDLLDSELKIKLDNYMEVQEPYIDPSLSLYELAKGLELSSLELSVFLNKQLGKNFFDFINEYRINKAKEMLEDHGKNKLTVLEILYDVGFNSKSSFNTAFKKNTGFTPTEYRRKYVLSPDKN
ncbi:MAG: hypothetical protein C0591_12610 [Marinilabiliales bacterium]|nr:MAG: hypothetical protein C0591_12610 [Marinilabiliales bacterium]